MQFIEMTGKTLNEIAHDGHVGVKELQAAGVKPDSLIRVNEQGDIEIRRRDSWDIIGGLIGDFADRLKAKTGLDFA